MKSKTILHMAFGVVLFHLLGHTLGHFTWKDTEDTALSAIIAKMYSHEFEFMGKMQTLGGHHDGYSLLFGLTLIMGATLTAIAWNRIGSDEFRPVLLIIGSTLTLFGIVEMVYFFPLAGGSSLLAGILHLIVYGREAKRLTVSN